MATTLKDIAAAAGVSIGTVDRALNNRKRINPQVAEQIRKLAKEMNYQPNKVASGLVRKNRNYKIAVIFHTKENDFWRGVIQGIHKAETKIRDYGMSVQLYFGKNFSVDIQLSLIEQAIAKGANALVIVPIDAPAIIKRIHMLQKEQFPIIFLNTFIKQVSVLSSIHCDYYRTGRIAGMLINRFSGGCGHVLAFLPSPVMHGNNERKNGILDYFNTAPSTLVLDKIIQLHNDREIDIDLIEKELNEHKKVNYIIYNGDADVYLSAIEKVKRHFVSIFFDLSDNTKNALIKQQIDAVITQDETEQGYLAIDALFQYLVFDVIPKKEILMNSTIVFKECID